MKERIIRLALYSSLMMSFSHPAQASFGEFLDKILPPAAPPKKEEAVKQPEITTPEKPQEPRRPANIPGPKETEETLKKLNAEPAAPTPPVVTAPDTPGNTTAPTPQVSIPKSYIRTLYQSAEMEDGRRVSITTDQHGKNHAYIEGPSGRKSLVPNGHYEILNGKLIQLEPHNFALTNDTSVLLSIYNGKVINYLPKWAVDAGEYTDF